MIKCHLRIPRSDQSFFHSPLASLLDDLIPRAGISDVLPSLIVNLMPGVAIGSFVNEYMGVQAYAEGHVLGGIAIPKVLDGELSCLIVIDEATLDGLTASHWPFNLVSTLLEELIHVALYAARWEQDRDEFSYNLDNEWWAEITASKIHDEYAAARLKSNMLATIPLVSTPSGYRSTVVLKYGYSLDSMAMAAQREVDNLRGAFHSGPCSLDEAVNRAQEIAFRGLLEPIARAQGFYDGCPEEMRKQEGVESVDLPGIEIAYTTMSDVWPETRSTLRESHNTEYNDIGYAVRRLHHHVTTVYDRLWDRVVRLEAEP